MEATLQAKIEKLAKESPFLETYWNQHKLGQMTAMEALAMACLDMDQRINVQSEVLKRQRERLDQQQG